MISHHNSEFSIVIVFLTEPGTFEFANPSYLFKGSSGEVEVPILRINGADGRAWVEFQTEEMSAKAGTDFQTVQGRLEFAHGEITKSIVIPLLPETQTVSNLNFRLRLLVASEGAKIGRISNTVITIVDDQGKGRERHGCARGSFCFCLNLTVSSDALIFQLFFHCRL